MSTGNVTKYQNGTGLVADKTKTGLGLFQTVLLSVSVVSSIVLLLLLVYYVLRKRALNEARHHLVPLYHFDPGECEDWEEELLQDSKKETLRNGPKFYTSVSSSV